MLIDRLYYVWDMDPQALSQQIEDARRMKDDANTRIAAAFQQRTDAEGRRDAAQAELDAANSDIEVANSEISDAQNDSYRADQQNNDAYYSLERVRTEAESAQSRAY